MYYLGPITWHKLQNSSTDVVWSRDLTKLQNAITYSIPEWFAYENFIGLVVNMVLINQL